MNDFYDIVKDIQYNISMNIARYARKKGISYKEAAGKSFMTIDGVKIQPLDSNDYSFGIGTDGEPTPGDGNE